MTTLRSANGQLWTTTSLAFHPGEDETFENVKDRLRMKYIGLVVDVRYAHPYDIYMSKARGGTQYFAHDIRSRNGAYYLVELQS